MPTLPKLSEAASLALHTVAFLAADPKRSRQTKEIASALRASEAHLSKVLQRLGKVGLVRSIRGRKGGFLLGPEAGHATLLDVYESIDGPLPQNACLLGTAVCRGEGCVLGGLLAAVSKQVHDHLADTRVSQLASLDWRTDVDG
jgi:Rrf2 family protein